MNEISKELEELKNTKMEAPSNTPLRLWNPPTILTADMNFDVCYQLITCKLVSLGYSKYLENRENEDGSLKYDIEENEVKTKLNCF